MSLLSMLCEIIRVHSSFWFCTLQSKQVRRDKEICNEFDNYWEQESNVMAPEELSTYG